MKTITSRVVVFFLIIVSFLSFNSSISAASKLNPDPDSLIVGTWLGNLKIQTISLRIIFHINTDSVGAFTGTLDSPDQGATGIPLTGVSYKDENVKFEVGSIKGYFEGKLNTDSMKLEGIWNQSGTSFPLTLDKTEKKIEEPKRPQEPKPPFPYNQEEVKFNNEGAGVTLAGTLTYPNSGGPFPAVVMVTGSGKQNRDEELLGHKPFLVIADYLTKRGIAVLRYDDRGAGGSTGNFSKATTKDFEGDAISAVEYLMKRNEVDHKKIGIIGHSEGGLIAPMAAVDCKDVSFIVLLAGPGISGENILLRQTELIMNAQGDTLSERDKNFNKKVYDLLSTENDTTTIKNKLTKMFNDYYDKLSGEEKTQFGNKETEISNQLKLLVSPWFRYFLKYNPFPVLKQVKVPVLAMSGEKDLQVPPKEDLEAITKALLEGGNNNFQINLLPGLNHLFQPAKTGSPMEYAKIETTFSPSALQILGDWITNINHKQ
jgi:uncharacterized protein